MITSRVRAIPAKSINANTFTGNWQLVYDALPDPVFLLRIINNTKVPIEVSYDGATVNEFVASEDTADLNFQSNAVPTLCVNNLPAKTPVYVRAANSAGFVYITGYTFYQT